MTRVRRVDLVGGEALAAPVQLPNGTWVLEGYATRAGVLRYLNTDGTERLEFRPPEEVEKAAANLALCVLTHNHPPEGYVTPATAGKYQRGTVLEARWDSGSLRMPVRCHVTDKRLLDALAAGESELSPGYEATVTEEVGEWQGQRYTHVQRDIQHNHLAVVRRGRAGPECAMRLDAAGNVEVPPIPPIPVPPIDTLAVSPSNVGNRVTPPSSEGKEQPMEVEVVIGGTTFKVPEALAKALEVEKKKWEEAARTAQATVTAKDGELAQVKADVAKKDAEATTLAQKADAAEKAAKESRAAADVLKARVDSAEAEAERLKKERNDAASPEVVGRLVAERVALITHAKRVLGDAYDYTGEKARETKADAAPPTPHRIRMDTLEKLLEGKPTLKAKLPTYNEAQVAALFEVEMARFDAEGGRLGPSHSAPPGGGTPPGVDPFLAHQQKLMEKQGKRG